MRFPGPRSAGGIGRLCRIVGRGLLVILLGALPARAWEIKSFSGRDHVSLEEIATFYGLGEATSPDAKTRKLKGSGRSLLATLNSREMEINGIRHWLAFPVLEDDGKVYVSRLDLGKTLEPAFRPTRIPEFPPVSTVILDPGHGGRDNGARSPYEHEKNFALDIARRVRNALQKSGIRVILTRNSDSFVELADRAAVASRLKNAVFVSLHFNASDTNPAAKGFEIFCVTPRGAPSTAYEQIRERDMVQENGNHHDIHSFALANAIYHSMLGRVEMTDRGVKRARFAVIRLAEVPSVLVEGGFLTNADDARKVASKQWRDDYATSIARGILEYKKLAENHISPREVAAYRNPETALKPIVEAVPPPPVPGVGLRDLPQ
ncbi:MAG: N-acetylmuramoyl-L-alanine amidase [Chthoniobacterales bacterium]|nr:N-acetylmuramoyl-L-alanine amidase [Chthoniobacterales bacterium]